MEVPFERLSEETLNGLLAEFVSRDGTDYGEREVSMEDKMAAVKRQLARDEAVIVFDAESETCNIVLRRDLARMRSSSERA